MLILLFLSCVDPVYGPVATALEQYDAGRTALQEGDPRAAAEAFASAAAADSTRPALLGWQATALAEAGDVAGALAVLDRGLGRFPDDVDLRYNRAALRARSGALQLAADDLRWLYANEGVDPVEVGEDPDFVAMGTDPELARLAPRAQVEVRLKEESGSILLGERYTLEMEITGRAGEAPDISNLGGAVGLLDHVRTIEDVVETGPIWSRRVVRYEWRALGEGTAEAGPWMVSAGGTSTVTEQISVSVVGIPGQDRTGAAVPEPMQLSLPSALVGEREAPWVGELAGRRWAVVPEGARISPRDEIVGPEMVFRENGQPRWTVVGIGSGAVEIRKGPEVILAHGEAADRRPILTR